MALHPNNGIKSYYGADRIVPNEPDSCTVEAMLAERNDQTKPTPLSTEGWTPVRHTPKGNNWHKATDQLRGTEVYGSSGNNTVQWSIEFETAVPGYNEFLFATGDKELWLMATKAQVIGYYSNAPRIIMKSSEGGVKQARWYRRQNVREDPWISLTDHHDAIGQGYILYGGNNYGGSQASKILPIHDGADVYIRKSDNTGIGSCDDFCNTFKSMKCVGAHGDPNAVFQDGNAVNCDVQHQNGDVACQCALDKELLKEEEAYVAEPTSNACINLAFGGDLTSHEIYEYCDSNKTTCTVNVNVKGRDTTCSEFCSAHQDMQCVSASGVDYNQRLQCRSGSLLDCGDSSTKDYLQCECGFVSGSERADVLKQGPVLEENVQEMCPAYTKSDAGRNTNEKDRRYQKVVLTLGVDEGPEADGSIPIASAKMVPDYSDRNIDSYNTQDVEVCDGLEYTRKKKDPSEICSFGHRHDGDSNCYGKLEMTFSQASEKCAARGGHLLRLDNEDEFNKLSMVFRRQRIRIGLHSDDTKDGMEWDGYPGCKVDLAKDLPFLTKHGKSLRQDCWELNTESKSLSPVQCTETKTYICEAHRPSEKPDDRKSCKSDSDLKGPGGDLMTDEGGFCLWYLEDPKLALPDDESGGFRNTDIAHFLAFSEETRTRKYYKEYDHLIATNEFRGYYENEANWVNFTRSDLGLNSDDPVLDIQHETDDFHCHFSPTNFGISRIYLQQHMLERIYPGAFKKHCFCGYKHLGKLASRCDCTKNGVRNNNCQKEHRPMLYEATYKENGEYVYCNANQCDEPSP